MKKQFAFLFFLFSSLAFGSTQTSCFQIEGMSCGGCARRIQQLLKQQTGVLEVKVSFDTKTCELQYDPEKVKIETLLSLLKTEKYKTTEPESCETLSKAASRSPKAETKANKLPTKKAS